MVTYIVYYTWFFGKVQQRSGNMREKEPDKRKVQGAETKKKLYKVAEKIFIRWERRGHLIAVLSADH